MLQINVVLYEPEIPQNTGNIARTCAAAGASLHLIKPLGFSLRDRYLKRAGLDYWDKVNIITHNNINEFLRSYSSANIFFITKKATHTYDRIKFTGDVYLVFGKETYGLPENILDAYKERCFRIPMREDARSLNLSNAVAIVVYEALRQSGYHGLELDGHISQAQEPKEKNYQNKE